MLSVDSLGKMIGLELSLAFSCVSFDLLELHFHVQCTIYISVTGHHWHVIVHVVHSSPRCLCHPKTCQRGHIELSFNHSS